MKTLHIMLKQCFSLAAVLLGAAWISANATEPCDDFGECRVLIEINASDGDIGFHFLGDGDDLIKMRITDPDGRKVFEDIAKGPLREQTLTETFAESAEPLCSNDGAEEDEEIVTLEEFLDRWTAGTYLFEGLGAEGEMTSGETELTFELPAAPADLEFEDSAISWAAGDDLGECADSDDLTNLVTAGTLPVYPEDVAVAAWEVVLEPDVEDGNLTGALVFSIRVPGDIEDKKVTVPQEYLDSLPENTPVKIEVGAIGLYEGDPEDYGNATFTEEDGFCVNENDTNTGDEFDGCGFEIDDNGE